MAAPAWQAIQPDLVERSLLPQAAALNGLNMNVARAVGPAIGGLVVAWVGAGWVFALNAVSFVGIAAVIGMWRPPERAAAGPRERLVEALRSGGRYVRNALIVRRLLYRAILFIPAASAVWALLPVLAAGNLGLGSAGYGLLLGMVGIGAVAGAFVIPRVRARIGSARMVTGAMVITAVALAVIAASSNPLVVGVALLPVGSAWIAVMSSLNSGLQLTLPNWVRARGLAYYLVVFQGAQALGGVLWGVVADATSVTVALLVAAAVLAVGARGGPAHSDAGHDEAGPHTVDALARTPADLHPGRRRRPGARHGDLPRAGGQRGRVHRGDGPRGPLPQAHGRPAVGAVPRRRRSHPVRRVLPRRHLGRARAAAREQAHRRRPPVRGSVDSVWLVPHFEKMLYDQAQLAISYLEAHQITHDAFYAEIARGIFDYVLRDMTHPEGGFYSAEDADSMIDPANPKEKGEGAFYVWSYDEIHRILGDFEAVIFCVTTASGRMAMCRTIRTASSPARTSCS